MRIPKSQIAPFPTTTSSPFPRRPCSSRAPPPIHDPSRRSAQSKTPRCRPVLGPPRRASLAAPASTATPPPQRASVAASAPVRSFALRVALARRHRKRRVVDAQHPVPTPLRRRRHSNILPRARRFPGLRPFALRLLLATGSSAPRRRRKPVSIDMGNYFSRRLRLVKNAKDDDSELQRRGCPVSRVESEPEAESGGVIRRELGNWSVRALFKPLTDKDEMEVDAVLNDSGHRYYRGIQCFILFYFVCNTCLT
jgi:hypothetical protein